MSYVDFQTLKQHDIVSGFQARFVHSDHMILAYWNIDAFYPVREDYRK